MRLYIGVALWLLVPVCLAFSKNLIAKTIKYINFIGKVGSESHLSLGIQYNTLQYIIGLFVQVYQNANSVYHD
jgi:hypothetical protein